MILTPLAHQLHQDIRRRQLFRPGERILVGVSGGPDSMALLALLAELRAEARWTLWGVYVDHGWRPAAARRELALVRRIGRQLRVPIRVVRLRARKTPRRSWEGTARTARYAALRRVARQVRATAVAVAHTQDDQAETVLLALCRGAGLSGARGMPWQRSLDGASGPLLVRPLLAFRHEMLRRYLRQRRIPWKFDATNAQRRFRRNALRHTVLPPLTRLYGAGVIERLATFAGLAHDDDAYLETIVERWCHRHVRRRSGAIRVARGPLHRQPPALQRRVIRWMMAHRDGLAQSGLAACHVQSVLAVAAAGRGDVHLPGGVMARATRPALTIRPRC